MSAPAGLALDLGIPPGRQGFRMPAEWAPHAATWLTWPHKEASWPGKLEAIPPIFVEMARELARGERVHLTVPTAEIEAAAHAALENAGAPMHQIAIERVPTNDSWIRDYGPIFVNRPAAANAPAAQAVVDWDYNAWGAKYPPYDLDNAVPAHLARRLGLPRFSGGMVLEGGSIDVNGQGLLLTTEACLLNPNRNPALDRSQIEQRLRDYLGVERILWLGDGIAGDDTDGHVDDLARFVAPETIVTVVEPDPNDENHAPLQANLERLHGFRTARGRPFTIHTLPMPDPVICEDQRLPASYANFYIGNQVVLVPQFACAQDAAARHTLAALFPTRRIVGLDCRDLVWGLGAFHCLTQQQPAV